MINLVFIDLLFLVLQLFHFLIHNLLLNHFLICTEATYAETLLCVHLVKLLLACASWATLAAGATIVPTRIATPRAILRRRLLLQWKLRRYLYLLLMHLIAVFLSQFLTVVLVIFINCGRC